MGEKSHGRATTQAERAERVEMATRLIAEHGHARVASGLARIYDCDRRTAKRYVRAAQGLLAADMPTVVDASRLQVRQLLWGIIYEAETVQAKLAAIKQLTDLLGLAAPTRAELVVAERPRDTLAEFAARPDLLERQLDLAEELEDARSNPPTVRPGEASLPTVAIPGTSPGPPALCDETFDGPTLQPADRGNACEARQVDLQ